MIRNTEPELPKNILRNTLIFLVILLVIGVSVAAYALKPRPFTNDPAEYSSTLTGMWSIALD